MMFLTQFGKKSHWNPVKKLDEIRKRKSLKRVGSGCGLWAVGASSGPGQIALLKKPSGTPFAT
jgi:hypothetical protein